MLDVIIVGGSVAGLSAALYLGRSLRHTVVLDEGKPANRFSHASHGFFTRDGIAPDELLKIGREQLQLSASNRIKQQKFYLNLIIFWSNCQMARRSPRAKCCWQWACAIRCRHLPTLNNFGGDLSFTAPTVTAGRCAINRWRSTAMVRLPCTKPNSCAT